VKLRKYLNSNYTNFRNSNCYISYPKTKNDIIKIIDFAQKHKKKILPIGSGLSWFDTIFNSNNILVDLKKLKKKFIFNSVKGELVISSGYKIYQIISKINQHSWSLYSIPGGDDVSIGGCIGNDVHGKDSFKYGNFSENILEMEVILPNKKLIKCSHKKNSEIFKAVCGGLGLVGIITEVKLKLKPISKSYVSTTTACKNYKDLIINLYKNANQFEYINGWIDIFAKNENIGRSVIFKSKKNLNKGLKKNNINTSQVFNLIQNKVFGFCVRNNLIKYLNFFIFNLFKFKKININSYKDITFPLSSYGVDIKRTIHPNSFFEIQIIIKKKNIKNDLKEFIIMCQKLNLSGFVIGIKMHKQNNNFLSFADNGISININQIFNSKKNFSSELNNLKKLHNYVIKKGHKIYLCKDFLLNKKKILQNYPKFKSFLDIKKRYDKGNLFSSDFFQRIIS
jgi:decaprenylphospho-beta-D-ribofuranose 2-oxidase